MKPEIVSTRLWSDIRGDPAFADKIVEYVRDRDHVSFVELTDRFRGEYDLDGDYLLELPKPPNIVLWCGMSLLYMDTVLRLLADGRLHTVPASWWVYLIDGGIIHLPLVKRAPAKGYKEPHWLPTCLRVELSSEGSRRRRR